MRGPLTKALVDALVSGLPLGLVVAIVLAIAGVPTDLLTSAAAVAFGTGFATHLLSRKGFGVKLLGGVVALVVLAVVIQYWGDWSRFLGDSEEFLAAREGVTTPPLPAVRVGWPGGGSRPDAPAGSTARSGSATAPAAASPSPGSSGGASAPRSGGGGSSVEALELPGGVGESGDSVVTPTPEVARVLLIRNPLAGPVEVGVTGPEFELPAVVLESGDSTEMVLGDADPYQAEVTWVRRGDRHSTPWAQAALGGGPFDIPDDVEAGAD